MLARPKSTRPSGGRHHRTGNQLAEIDVTSHSTGVLIKQTIPGLIDWATSVSVFLDTQRSDADHLVAVGLSICFRTQVTKFQLINTIYAAHAPVQGFVKTLTEDAK
jgi:hypothetical protein